jgi:hypothetical protein
MMLFVCLHAQLMEFREILCGGHTIGQCEGLTTLPPSVSRMFENVGASTSCNPESLCGLYRDNVFTLRATGGYPSFTWQTCEPVT